MTIETTTNVPNSGGTYTYFNLAPLKCDCHQCTQARYEVWRSQSGIGPQMQNGGNQ